jgi:hypothetical protein
MAIIKTEGFDLIANAAGLLQKGWTVAEDGAINTTASQWGGRCWDCGGSTTNVLCAAFANPISFPYISAACWRKYTGALPDVASGNVMLFAAVPPSINLMSKSSSHAALTNGAAGSIVVSRGGGTVVTTLVNAIQLDVWQHYEMRVYINNSVGTLEVWLDGIKVVDIVGDTLDSASECGVQFTGNANPTNCFVDDVVMAYSATTPHPQIGPHRIHTLLPDGAGTNSAWTGSNLDVDDPFGASDGDTTFAVSATLNAKQDYSFGNLIESPASIMSVTVVTDVRKTDIGTVGVTPYIISNGVTSAGVEAGLSEAYKAEQNIYTLNPDGSVAWTETSVNALLAGHEITT